jgi:hypothetical protein
MKNKLIKLIISGLLIILTVSSIITYKSYERNKNAKIQSSINNQVKVEQQTYRVISSKEIINKIQRVNSKNVLSCQCTVSKTFTNKSISSDDSEMSWINKWFQEENSQDVTISREYKFLFAYDNTHPQVYCKNGEINIYLSPNNLSLISLERLSENSKDRIGGIQSIKNATNDLLNKSENNSFNTTQRNALSMRVQQCARNSIMSYSKYRNEAMENTKQNILDDLKSYLGDDIKVNFQISNYDVVQQTDASIINDDII